MKTAFHLAIGVENLQKAKDFYIRLLSAKEGRSSGSWVDFDLFGHQLSCHLIKDKKNFIEYNQVDKKAVPIPHFGLIVSSQDFDKIQQTLEKSDTVFILKACLRFKGLDEEQKTMFFKDPFGNCIEIKSFTNPNKVFL